MRISAKAPIFIRIGNKTTILNHFPGIAIRLLQSYLWLFEPNPVYIQLVGINGYEVFTGYIRLMSRWQSFNNSEMRAKPSMPQGFRWCVHPAEEGTINF